MRRMESLQIQMRELHIQTQIERFLKVYEQSQLLNEINLLLCWIGISELHLQISLVQIVMDIIFSGEITMDLHE